jgi:hypothetical protein
MLLEPRGSARQFFHFLGQIVLGYRVTKGAARGPKLTDRAVQLCLRHAQP